MADVTDYQIYNLDPAVDTAPSDWLGGDASTAYPPTSYADSVFTPAAASATVGGATPYQWATAFGGIAASIANAVNPAKSVRGMPAGFYRDPRTGATVAVGAGGQMAAVPAQQPSLTLLLLLGLGLALVMRRG